MNRKVRGVLNPEPLEVWGIARGADVLTVTLLCREHATWTRDSDFYLPLGFRAFQVKSRSWVRRMLRSAEKHRSGCTECAFRAGRRLLVKDVGPLGIVKASELDVTGGEA